MARRVVISDIDGTLALHGPFLNDRGHYEYEKSGADAPNWPVMRVLESIRTGGYGIEVIFVSGREDRVRDLTVNWLASYLGAWVRDSDLHMRPTGDHCPDYELKRRIYDEHLCGLDILCVLEDRDQVVKLWRSLGLTCLQVADGDF